MSRTLHRIGYTVALILVLGSAPGCATAAHEPAASPRTEGGDASRCIGDGGVWRNGTCDTGGGGGY